MKGPKYRRITGEWERGGSQDALDLLSRMVSYGRVIAIVLWVAIFLFLFYYLDPPEASLMFLIVTSAGVVGVLSGRKVLTEFLRFFEGGLRDRVKMFDTTYGEAVRASLDALESLGWDYTIEAKGNLAVPGRGPLVEDRSDRTTPVEESKEVTLRVEEPTFRVEVSEMKDIPFTHLEYIHVRIGPVTDDSASGVQAFEDYLDGRLRPFLLDPEDYDGR